MDGQNRKAPLGSRCGWAAGDWNCGAETFRILSGKMPGSRATHAEAGDGDLFHIDTVPGQDHVKQCVYSILVFRTAPVTSQRVWRDDDRSELRQSRTNENPDDVPAGTSRVSIADPEVQSQ